MHPVNWVTQLPKIMKVIKRRKPNMHLQHVHWFSKVWFVIEKHSRRGGFCDVYKAQCAVPKYRTIGPLWNLSMGQTRWCLILRTGEQLKTSQIQSRNLKNSSVAFCTLNRIWLVQIGTIRFFIQRNRCLFVAAKAAEQEECVYCVWWSKRIRWYFWNHYDRPSSMWIYSIKA